MCFNLFYLRIHFLYKNNFLRTFRLNLYIYCSKQWVNENNLRLSLIFQVLIKKWSMASRVRWPISAIFYWSWLETLEALEFELVRTSDMSGNIFQPHHHFSIDTAGILMKRETALNRFTISFDKYHFYKVNIWLIKPINSNCCFSLWKFQQSLLKTESCRFQK